MIAQRSSDLSRRPSIQELYSAQKYLMTLRNQIAQIDKAEQPDVYASLVAKIAEQLELYNGLERAYNAPVAK